MSDMDNPGGAEFLPGAPGGNPNSSGSGVPPVTPIILLTLGVYTNQDPLGTVQANGTIETVFQGQIISVYVQVTTPTGTLQISEAPTYKVYDALGYGGIAPAQPVSSYDGAALAAVTAQITLDTSLLPTGLFTVIIAILTNEGSRSLCRIGLNVLDPLL